MQGTGVVDLERQTILLTNDDGWHAEGLRTLAAALAAQPWADPYIVAPDREMSASGHSITVMKPLHADQVSLPGLDMPAWAVTGTPADCVKLGVNALAPAPPSLVVSGINRGPNLGTDVFYSGTVSAAIEAAIMSIPAVAISLAEYERPEYSVAASFAVRLAREVLKRGLPDWTLLNVNVPAVRENQIAGVARTRHGVRRWKDSFIKRDIKREDPRGRTYYWLDGRGSDLVDGPDTDVHAIRNNMISVCPIHLDLTSDALLRELGEWEIDGVHPGEETGGQGR